MSAFDFLGDHVANEPVLSLIWPFVSSVIFQLPSTRVDQVSASASLGAGTAFGHAYGVAGGVGVSGFSAGEFGVLDRKSVV